MSEIILFIGFCLFITSYVLFCVCILNCFSDRLNLILGRVGITSAFISLILIAACVIYKSLKDLL